MKIIIPPHHFNSHGRKSFLFNLFPKLFFIALFISFAGTEIVGQVVIREKIILKNYDSLRIFNRDP